MRKDVVSMGDRAAAGFHQTNQSPAKVTPYPCAFQHFYVRPISINTHKKFPHSGLSRSLVGFISPTGAPSTPKFPLWSCSPRLWLHHGFCAPLPLNVVMFWTADDAPPSNCLCSASHASPPYCPSAPVPSPLLTAANFFRSWTCVPGSSLISWCCSNDPFRAPRGEWGCPCCCCCCRLRGSRGTRASRAFLHADRGCFASAAPLGEQAASPTMDIGAGRVGGGVSR